MFIDKDLKRINPYATIIFEGVEYHNVMAHAAVVQALEIQEIPEPPPPEDYDPDFYFKTEQDEMPYVVYTRKSEESIGQIMAKRYEQALDAHFDATAKAHRWDNRFTFMVRAGFPGPYQAEAISFASWVDSCNQQAYALLLACQRGEAPMPVSIAAFLATLPVFPPLAE